MGAAGRTYGGLTGDERSAIRRTALLEAALDLFSEGGSRAVTKRAVCARARLNDRYFDEHFDDPAELLEAVTREQTAQLIDVVVASAEAGTDLTEQATNLVRSALSFVTADARRGALLLDAHATDVLQRMKRESAATIAMVLTALFHDTDAPSTRSPAETEVMAYALVSGAMELIAGWMRGDLPITVEQCADLVAELLLSVPRIPSTTGRGGC